MRIAVAILLTLVPWFLPAQTSTTVPPSIGGLAIKSGITCASDGYIVTWVAASSYFDCLNSGAAGSVLFSGVGAGTNANALVIGTGGSLAFTGTGVLDASAGGTAALKVPVVAGATASANGVVAYDSTNLNTHVRTNNADSIVAAFAAAPTTNVVPKSVIASGNTILQNSLLTDNGTTATYTGTGGYSAPILVSTVAGGTAPLTVTSSTQVTNLNSSQLVGATWVAPGTIGSTTPSTGAFTSLAAGSAKWNVNTSGLPTQSNNITLAGQGFPLIFGITSQKSETTTPDANVLTVTPASAVGSYRLSVQISVSAATSCVVGWTATWTDANGNAQSPVELSLFQDATAAPALTFTTSAASNYYGSAMIDVNNAGTNIVIKWIGGGTCTAKMSAMVERII